LSPTLEKETPNMDTTAYDTVYQGLILKVGKKDISGDIPFNLDIKRFESSD
jgi:hypothetical protein